MRDDRFNQLESRTASPIFLVGFMGAGKTTVGRALAQLLGYKFLDLDDVIEQSAGKRITAIFSEDGEAEFRRIESLAIKSCRGLADTVIALGGGAYISEENRDNLRQIGLTVWLECPLDVCLNRTGTENSRPLLGKPEEMQQLLEKREIAYSQADFRVQSGRGTPVEIAAEIALAISN